MKLDNRVAWAVMGALLVGLLTSSGMALRNGKKTAELDAALVRARAETDALRLRQEEVLWRPFVAEATFPAEDSGTDEAGARNEIERLESKVRELEAALSELERQRTARPARTQEDGTEGEATPRRQRFDLESLRESDPERHKEIVDRREQMRERTRLAFTRKTDFLGEQNLSELDEAEQAEHKRMMELLQEMQAQTERAREEMTREERMQAWRTLGEQARELGPLLRKARDREFATLGKTLGYADEDAVAFADYLNEVVETTSLTGGLMPGGPGAGRGRRTTSAAPRQPRETPNLQAP